MINIVKTVGKSINALVAISPSAAGKLTLNLFCRPIEGRKYKPQDDAFLKKAKWKSIELDGKKIQCYVWGESGKKVLLAHGFNSNATRWRPLVGLLQNSGYQVIALDAPAHGKSDFTRVHAILYAKAISLVIAHFEPDFIVGHSFAGIAFSYYFSYLNYLPVEKIILMGVPNELMDVAKVYFEKLQLNEQVQKAYLSAFEDKFDYDMDYFTLSKMVNKIPFPALIIHDEQDDIASFKGAEEIHKNWKNSVFFGTQKLGHSLQGRNVYNAILESLSERVGERSSELLSSECEKKMEIK